MAGSVDTKVYNKVWIKGHIIKKSKKEIRTIMKKWGTKIAVNFLVRGIVSFAIIFFVNGFLDGQGISACVGMNPVTFLTSGILGFPGVAMLYGITFYQIM